MEEHVLDQNLNNAEGSIDYRQKFMELEEKGYEFKFGEYISRGFELFKANIGGFILFTLLYFVISAVAGLIPFVGGLISTIVLQPALIAGYFVVGKKIHHGEPYEFNDFFKGFEVIKDLSIAKLLIIIFVLAGTVLLVLPGIYLAVAYSAIIPIILFSKIEFWDAMEICRKLVTKNWFAIFGFIIVIALINLLGVIALIVGIFVTVPATYLAVYAAFEDIVGTTREG